MLQIKVVAFAVVIWWTLHFSSIDLTTKRTKCKIADLKNTSLDFGTCLVNTETCDVYWCCDDTDRFGELLKYHCNNTVLRLYTLLTRECRKQGCIPQFTWDNSFWTESLYEKTMPPNPLYDHYTEGIPKSDEEESTVGVEDESTPTSATGATVVAGTSVATESVTSS